MTVLNAQANNPSMEDVCNNVKVIVRVRPPNDLEKHKQGKDVVEIMDGNFLVFDPKEEESPFLGRYGKRRHRDLRKRRQKDLKFAFDHVFGLDSSNLEVFEQTTKTVLDGLLGGYNSSVFAYGATGAGKTHTMLGSENNPGVIYYTMTHLYRHITDMSPDKTCDVAVSYLEVYNEQIRDLLMPRGTLPIREDRNTGVVVPGLSLHKPRSAEELLHMLQFGNQNRTQHPTDANAESSRSHAVFQVFVRQKDRTANLSAQVKVAKMCLVDLAGSERATITKNRGLRFREGANINRSLLALGNVINCLADCKYKGHIPYRDSKLTRLLKDSLGGNCRTIMIAAVSPSELSYEDTYNTLKYADRAKNIRLNMKKNVLSVDFHVSQYGKIVEELRREITELKTQLQQCQTPAITNAESLCLPARLQGLHSSLQAAYKERRCLRDRQLRQEISMRHSQWRLYRKHKGLRRASMLDNSALPGRVEKIQGEMDSLQRKVLSQETERQSLCSQLHTNTQALHSLHCQVKEGTSGSTSIPSQMLELSTQKMSLEVEVNDARHYIHHLRRLARAQEQEAVASETLIAALLQLVQHQHKALQNCGGLTPQLTSAYQGVCDMVGQAGVCWADEGQGEEGAPVFHINSIIDIPLVTSHNNGVVLNRVCSPGHPTTGTSVSSTGLPGGSTVFTTTCPGLGTNTHGTAASTQPPLLPPPSTYSPRPLHSLPPTSSLAFPPYPGVADARGAPVWNQPSTTKTDVSSQHPADLSSSSTIHAGHTPNPKTLPSQQTLCGQRGQIANGAFNEMDGDKNLKSTSCLSPAPLNSTFSLQDSGLERNHLGNSTVLVERSSNLCLPAVGTQPLHCAGKSVPLAEKPNTDKGFVEPNCRREQIQNVQGGSTQPAVSAQSNGTTSAVVIADKPGSKRAEGCERSASNQNRENEGPCSNGHSNARRAINFDGANTESTPMRVESKSYADALRTPTPPRQPLRTLDNNSPRFQTSHGDFAQTPKSSGVRSNTMCNVSPDVINNMRRLKQLGLPSLVENLVNGKNYGVSEVNRPGYMQPTKATARRVRRQTVSKDDCFNPRRVPNKTLAHSRSKSASQLNRTGWKI